MRGEGGVAGEGRVGLPKFHSWGKCTMPLTNVNSDWMSNASSDLCINLVILFTRVLYFYVGKSIQWYIGVQGLDTERMRENIGNNKKNYIYMYIYNCSV